MFAKDTRNLQKNYWNITLLGKKKKISIYKKILY